MNAQTLIDKIKSKKAKVGVVGLGYVGLPLALTFAQKGFSVFGIDIDIDRIKKAQRGESYILDVAGKDIIKFIKKKRFQATSDFSVAKELDAVIICVPTPLKRRKEPDVSFIISAVRNIKKFIRPKQIIILESTTYPGTTEEVILPMLESTGLKEGRDFYLAFSPERVDPANPRYKTYNTPKVIGGICSASTKMAKLLYSQVIKRVVPASSAKVAEMCKLLENTFRIVNIAMVNEIMLMCDKLGIDVWEVIDVAKTKPYGFMPFYPGPGVGGHCIPVDPIYLSWKARGYGFAARFIDLASEINSKIPSYVVEKIAAGLKTEGKALKGSRVLIVGLAYKKDVKDLRESPALEIIELLQRKKALVSYYDPFFPYLKFNHTDLKCLKFRPQSLSRQDCTVIVTDHSAVDYKFILEHSNLIIDTRNVYRNLDKKGKKVLKL